MRYTLNIPVSGNDYDILFGYHLTSWNDGSNKLYKFWTVSKSNISEINGEYSFSPEIDTANVSVPQLDGTSEIYDINMECVDSVYGVKCKWYAIPLCSTTADEISYENKVKGNFNNAEAYWGENTLEKISPNTIKYFSDMNVKSNIWGLILKDSSSIFTEEETVTASKIIMYYFEIPYELNESVTFKVVDGYLICDDPIDIAWETDNFINKSNCVITVNGNDYHLDVEFVSVYMKSFKQIFGNDIDSEEDDEYAISCKYKKWDGTPLYHNKRGYIPNSNLIVNNKYIDEDIEIDFSDLNDTNSDTYVCSKDKSSTFKITSTKFSGGSTPGFVNVLSELDCLPSYPLVFCVTKNRKPGVKQITSDDFNDLVGPIEKSTLNYCCTCAGQAGYGDFKDYTNNRF